METYSEAQTQVLSKQAIKSSPLTIWTTVFSKVDEPCIIFLN